MPTRVNATNTVKGEPVDLEQIFRAHERDVFVYFLRVTGDAHLAEDLAQDTLLRAWEGMVRFRGDASFKTWLLAIARTRLADHYRKKPRELFVDPPDEPIKQDEDVKLTIEQVLQALPLAHREAVVLCDVFGFEPSEAAEATGLNVNAFRVRLHRARRRFRELYGDVG